MKLLKYLYFSICFLFLMAMPAYAYVDPSVVTTAVQVIAGVAVVIGTVAGVAWRRAKRALLNKLGKDGNGKKEVEPDVIWFSDDEDDEDEEETTPITRYAMAISTQNRTLYQTYGHEKALEILAEAGFDHVDMSFTPMAKDPENEFLQPDAEERCRAIRAKAESLGLSFNQCHAPFQMDMKPWLEGDREPILHLLRTSIRLAGVLGAKIIVVHPVQCMNYLNNDPEWIKQVNVEFYSMLIPTAQEAGVKIAIENMWQKNQYNKHIVSSVCSSPYELRSYVDACNAVAPVFTACLDIGHCLLTGHDPVNSIHVLGDRLGCLHVHDVDGINDNHNCPMTMKVDFPAVMEALWEIGYKGEFTLEADAFYSHFPKEQYPFVAKQLASVSKLLANP